MQTFLRLFLFYFFLISKNIFIEKTTSWEHEEPKQLKKYSLRPTLFVLFEKSNILREHHLLSCLSYKNI